MGVFASIGEQIYDNLIYKARYMYIVEGLKTTLLLTLFSALIGVVIGVCVALIKVAAKSNRRLRFFEILADVYLTVIRGTPMLVQLFVTYYIALGPFGVNKIFAAIISFGINSGAYVAEIIRGGILSVDKGQLEAGRSLGLNYRTTMTKIIFPQALKNILPALGNECVTLIKETSVAGFIGVMDLTKAGNIIHSQTYEPVVPLLSVAAVYLVLVVGLTTLLSKLERRLRKSDIR